ncbi:UPF0223 family protein [Lapidilactobacillus achengensis]|uniref:UPF0223 family protein n=1 Tax=Lapidilactobacillus achengensis TaxID=2486000 RepID=A0ABW1UUN8_9LACO|nr:UPF0223 family protein [Lapidilactobacillus achengensis]
MEHNYSYPLDPDWSTAEILLVMHLYNLVEAAYEHQVSVAEFRNVWHEYTHFYPAKMDQRRLDHEFNAVSGYSIYRVQQAVNQAAPGQKTITMK